MDEYLHRLAETQAIERELSALRDTVDVVAYRGAQEAVERVNERLGSLAAEHGNAVCAAALEAARAYVDEHVVPLYAAAIRARGVVDELGRHLEMRDQT
jgi:hypothetical protein